MRNFVPLRLRSLGFSGNGRRRSKEEKEATSDSPPSQSAVRAAGDAASADRNGQGFAPAERHRQFFAGSGDQSDPQVTGTVQGDFSSGYVEVQFDHFGDGNVDGYTHVADRQGGRTLFSQLRRRHPLAHAPPETRLPGRRSFSSARSRSRAIDSV